jgi:hypothetical protein
VLSIPVTVSVLEAGDIIIFRSSVVDGVEVCHKVVEVGENSIRS